MGDQIRIGIMGYGNLGRGVELALRANPDMKLAAFFTRRDPAKLKTLSPDVPVYSVSQALEMKDAIDVMILCGGSATDLPVQSVEFAKYFNIVDSFDNHAKIPEHFEACDKSAQESGKIALISCGWDPGMFSLQRLLGNCILPNGSDYTFWGKGVSQGHSDAIRRIEGVQDAKQYTVPVDEALERVRSGENPELTARQKHTRECFVVAAPGADKERIANEIKTMPNYFEPYNTTVHFHYSGGVGPRPRRHSPRRFRNAQRCHRRERRDQADDRVFSEIGLQSRVHLQRSGVLRQSSVAHEHFR